MKYKMKEDKLFFSLVKIHTIRFMNGEIELHSIVPI
jgi:hypothetical protein